jgi:hypothetical protein
MIFCYQDYKTLEASYEMRIIVRRFGKRVKSTFDVYIIFGLFK